MRRGTCLMEMQQVRRGFLNQQPGNRFLEFAALIAMLQQVAQRMTAVAEQAETQITRSGNAQAITGIAEIF